MIVVVAPYPSPENQKDGMIQRVAHIDELMVSLPRIYLDLSFRRFVRKDVQVRGETTVYRLNLITHFFLICRLIKRAKLLYIHSAYNALKAIAFPTDAHVVFDAHGIVPEELTQEGQALAARLFTFAERLVLRRCNTLICVTRSMLTHFNDKHGYRSGREEIILPILPKLGFSDDSNQALHTIRDDQSVIYAGGMQAWQNVDKMIAAAIRQPALTYTFLTGNPEQFKVRLQASSIQRFCCETVSPEQVRDYYLRHQYGFVLRELDIVNAVACPTKLVEYLYWGVLPIVITPRIGDFDETNLSGILLKNFENGFFPNAETAKKMRQRNQASVLDLIASAQFYQDRLRKLLRSMPQDDDIRP